MRERSEELKTLLDGLKSEEHLTLEAAFSKTRDYLPPGVSLPDATVLFLPIGYDSRVDGRSIYFDPLLAGIIGREGVIQLLSHELHHVSRFEMTGEVISGMAMALGPWLADRHGLVRLWALLLEMEGIADCIFKLSGFELPMHRGMIAERKQVYREYADHLSRVQKTLIQGAKERVSLRSRRADLAPLVLEHIHPIGVRLAQEIQNGLGRSKLVECVGKPELFLRHYQEVAQTEGLFRFDEALLAQLSHA